MTSELDFSRTIVSGDRNWVFAAGPWAVLDIVRPGVVIEGGARGVDEIARKWAISRGVERERYDADWDRFKRAAGPIRNREMADKSPTFVLAFHDRIETSKGTADMLCVAEDRGIPYALLTETDCERF